MRCVWNCLVVVALLFSSPLVLAQGGPIRYVYDELGRLTAVIDQNGDAATYHYDAVGNLTGITRTSTGSVAIFEFTPNGAPIGTVVTLSGIGFSSTPAQNTVAFNGTATTVSAATATSLIVSVPAGATTGTIAVTTPSGSATSSAAFTVMPATAPTVTGFTPGTAVTATSVVITGTNFDPVPANTKVRFNGGFASLTAVTPTSLTVAVPGGRGSGRITVDTPEGKGVSAGDFIIPPLPYVAADVAVTGRIAFGTATAVSVSTANKIGLTLFDGTPGQRVSLLGTGGMSGQAFGCDLMVSIFRPEASVLGSGCMESSGFIDVMTLVGSDAYTIMVDPAAGTVGGVTLTLYDVPADFSATTTPGASPVTISTTIPGQNAVVTFSGAAGQRVSLRGTDGMKHQILACDAYVSILNPDGSVLAAATCMEDTGFIDVKTLPVTGTYRIVVDPVSTAIGNLTLTLYDVPADYNASITAGGQAVTGSMPTPGQNGAVTFSGTSGQRISLRGTNGLSVQVLGCDVNVRILMPDASVLAANTCMEGSGYIDTKTLPTTGTYTIVVDPVDRAVGNVTLTLFDVPADYTGSITAGGSAVTVSMPTAGQNGAVTFSGVSGQRISLRGTNGLSGQVLGCDVNVRILKPDASVLAANTCMESDGFIDTKVLPTTGTYTIVVDPVAQAVGNVTLTLYDVPADTTGTVTIGGSAVAITLGTPGQIGTLTFSGTASQQITVRLSSNTVGWMTVRVLKPDGSQLTSLVAFLSSFNLSALTLPTTGTYTIVVDPRDANTGTVTVSVTNP